MNYIKINEDNLIVYPYSLSDLPKDYPNISFPQPFENTTLSDFNIFPVIPSALPMYNRATHKLIELTPSKVNDNYVEVWDVQELTQAEKSTIANIIKDEIVTHTQESLDLFAKTRNYDGILSLCTYATSPNPKFAAEGQKGVELRDATWTKLYQILEEVQNGTRPMPSSYQDVESELPMLTWE